MTQLQLFNRKALIEYPPAKASADSRGEVEADDACRYYIKGDAHGRPVRASEWLSTQIAEMVGVAAPAPVTIELSGGEVVFGSRRIAGVADDVTTASFLTTPTNSNAGAPAVNLKTLLSRIYALDMFLNNDDRHLGNYLSVDDNGVRRLYAFDFSRALFWTWPWQGFPGLNCNTRQWGRILRSLHGFDPVAANAVLDGLSGLPVPVLQQIVNHMPSGWLGASASAEFLAVWTTDLCQKRVQDLKTGLGNGSLL